MMPVANQEAENIVQDVGESGAPGGTGAAENEQPVDTLIASLDEALAEAELELAKALGLEPGPPSTTESTGQSTRTTGAQVEVPEPVLGA